MNTNRADNKIRAAERADFTRLGTWRRSGKGNLGRVWDGLNLTIFRRKDGGYSWCIADDDGPRYSTTRFESEVDAIDSLSLELVY